MRNLALSLALIAGLFVPMGTIHYLPTNRQKVVAQFRRGNRGSRRAKQPLVPPRLSAISAPCTNAGRVQKWRGRELGPRQKINKSQDIAA